MNSENIFAGINSFGGSVYTFRISGKNLSSLGLIIKNFNLETLDAGIFYRKIIDPKNGKILDRALISVFKSPKSFTGENVVEISLHGSLYIINRMQDLFVEVCKFRLAENGEFSKRSFLNGKIDLVEAEGINAMVRASNESQHIIASAMLEGEVSKKYKYFRSLLINAMAMLEAGVDFPEDEIPESVFDEAKSEIKLLKSKLNEELSKFEICKVIEDGILVSLIGGVNAGKSSIINALSEKKVAIVSDIAGTTRDCIKQNIEVAGSLITLADTAGIRPTEDQIEKEGVEISRQLINESQIRLFVISKGNSNLDSYSIKNSDAIIINKCDLMSADEIKKMTTKLKSQYDCAIIKSEAVNGKGIKDIIKFLEDKVANDFSFKEPPGIVNQRHMSAIKEALSYLNTINFELPVELILSDLTMAASSIASVIGRIDSEDVLDSVFQKFCIGK